MPDLAYTPIACSFHDRLESWAVRRETVSVAWRDGDTEHASETTIADVFARDGADWVRLGTGAEIRADRLVSVGGVAITRDC
jgi:Rho-binding antiterminator